ncbi:MAG: DnaA regulatory inactivator Hda [Acidiferrobacterales bacterium]
MKQQLPLNNIRLKDSASFDNFYATCNREPVEQLIKTVRTVVDGQRAKERLLYFWGEAGSGKTHLLQAACQLAQAQGEARAAYIPLAECARLSPQILEELENVTFVCIDDLRHVCDDLAWETALFTLCERSRSHARVLIVADRMSPMNLGLKMPDLTTRLSWGLVYQLQPLTEQAKLAAIRLRARNRGFEMSEDVVRYVLRRYPRDTRSLFDLLERIDRTSLARKRRVTIPFIRELE